jgi:DNA-binding transcriptional ArsR family regulator
MHREDHEPVSRKSRSEAFTPELLELVARRFRLLSEPLRLQILQALDSHGEMSIGALAESLDQSQPNISKHVRVLVDAGMVGRRQEGTTVYCSISDPTVFELCDVVCGSLRERLAAEAAVLGRPSRRR